MESMLAWFWERTRRQTAQIACKKRKLRLVLLLVANELDVEHELSISAKVFLNTGMLEQTESQHSCSLEGTDFGSKEVSGSGRTRWCCAFGAARNKCYIADETVECRYHVSKRCGKTYCVRNNVPDLEGDIRHAPNKTCFKN